MLIVVFHSAYYVENDNGGAIAQAILALIGKLWIGVPIFFVISGYCISATIDSHRRHERGPPTYIKRRFRRIYPTYWILLAIMAGLIGLTELFIYPGLFRDNVHPIGAPWDFDAWQWAGSLTLTESWRYAVVGTGSRGYLFGPIWTLCYEEQFYVVAGILFFLCRQSFFESAVILSLACLLIQQLRCRYGWSIDGVFVDGGWLMFAAGIAVYYAVNHATKRNAKIVVVLLGAASVITGIAWITGRPIFGLMWSDWWMGPMWLAVAFGFAFCITLLHPFDQRIVQCKALEPLRWCGLMCYSMYLLHWPIVKAMSHLAYDLGLRSTWATLGLTIPACVIVSVACSSLAYLAVERHFVSTSYGKPRELPASALPT